MDSNSVLTYVMLGVLALLVIFMFRNSRKRQRSQQELQEKVVPGAEVMTNFGLFGTIISIDSDDNKVVLQTGPGSTATVHRQTIARVVDDASSAPISDTEVAAGDTGVEPEYGERLDDDDKKSD